MNCDEAKKLIQAYGDGELDTTHRLDVENHLRGCAACSTVRSQQQALKSALNNRALQFKAPSELRKRVVAELQATVRPEPRPPFWTAWWRPAGAAAFAALLVFFLLSLPNRNSSSDRLVAEVSSSHVRSLMANEIHLMDVVSTDQHTVKPWFNGKVDFAPPVKDLVTQGFPLAGGRLDYIDGHPSAVLIFERQKHVINLFIWPVTTEAHPPGPAVTRNGYHLINWTDSGMTFWAVSDLNEKELRQFTELFRGN